MQIYVIKEQREHSAFVKNNTHVNSHLKSQKGNDCEPKTAKEKILKNGNHSKNF